MEDVLRWTLFIVGTVAIAGVLIHGLWVSRKSSGKAKSKAKFAAGHHRSIKDDGGSEPQFSLDDDITGAEGDAQGAGDFQSDFDDLGVGPVRVVSRNAKAPDVQSNTHHAKDDLGEIADDTLASYADDDLAFDSETQQAKADEKGAKNDENGVENPDLAPKTEAPTSEPKTPVTPGKVYASVVTQPKPEYTPQNNHYTSASTKQASDIPEPPTFLLKANDAAQTQTSADSSAVSRQNQEPQLDSQVTQKVMHTRKNEGASRKRKEPKFAEDQLNIDFDEQQQSNDHHVDEPQKSDTEQKAQEQPQEVLVLNVKTAEDAPIQGATLLPMLLTLGFKFGDQDIFHRHVNANGKGPVLFSLANMFKPGVFDIDNLENFTTQGITLFMILPIEGDPHQVFNMMHNATRKIADEFNGQILDGRRSMLTKQGLQQYVERIREFERKRMIHR
ncbi:cell division protein ZipA [Paraglaciecola sp. T6c]|uniref:cell division protein ZipA n=1 Tax=Pseudoalteromonas atlantica (strain T6c / ATCC BAA-1087) TaxID=3042615 RepID=UPI00005C5BBD|nr:cell division protein ZipA [Paraglaciecola sp. T6c]ABG40296.1 cell division protein ZipA [Paraglaciecola sp. T6c]